MFRRLFGGSTSAATQSRITFERTGEYVPGCPRGIFTVRPDGSDLRHIRESGQSPRWSPDGRRIAFSEGTRDNGGLQSVFVMKPDGTEARQLTHHHDVDATPPSWSPDSRWLSYSLFLWEIQKYDLCIVEVATNQCKRLLQENEAIYPVWAPSNKIMYSLGRGGSQSQLFEVDPNGERRREATTFQPGDSEPVWTPDGRKVVFGRDNGLGVMDTATGQTLTIRARNAAIQWAVAPDGESVAYAAQEQGSDFGFEIFVVRLSDQSKRKL